MNDIIHVSRASIMPALHIPPPSLPPTYTILKIQFKNINTINKFRKYNKNNLKILLTFLAKLTTDIFVGNGCGDCDTGIVVFESLGSSGDNDGNGGGDNGDI